jgi:fluoroacetyl-CoA thioesterase
MVEIGITLERKRTVSEDDSITFLGEDVKPSLSTPRMILWMEYAARDAVLPRLEPGQDTVGVRVDVRHLAATPLGAEVTYRATVSKVEESRITFDVEARDGAEIIGQGLHERYIVDVKRFAEGLRKKFGQAK